MKPTFRCLLAIKWMWGAAWPFKRHEVPWSNDLAVIAAMFIRTDLIIGSRSTVSQVGGGIDLPYTLDQEWCRKKRNRGMTDHE
ncbi:MAG: hypothetical protein ACQETX_02670 [Pseudomonadota bacterium]|uniref:hypothetical protein n=1 Tax=Fodinicurvata fenggangensis TaxID=1121830 RepID=UPI0012DD265D|nr:hypothetical protein [Fodinicurvata fenggangensis]